VYRQSGSAEPGAPGGGQSRPAGNAGSNSDVIDAEYVDVDEKK
jgi:hypothetical protein